MADNRAAGSLGAPNSSQIALMELDILQRKVRIHHINGQITERPLGDLSEFGESNLLRLSYKVPDNLLTLTTTRGDILTAELEILGRISDTKGRPVVYLDQGHWSTLANYLYEPSKVSPEDAAAAGHLIGLARSQQIILPMSSGHVLETTATYNSKRQNLAATILELSRGWMMRHPVDVRQVELISALSRRYRSAEVSLPTVFTLDPDALYSVLLHGPSYIPSQDLPAAAQHLLKCLVVTTATYDTLIDHEKIDSDRTGQWAEIHTQLSAHIRKLDSRPKKRQVALEATLTDVTNEIARAAAALSMTEAQIKDWRFNQAPNDLPKMPFLGLYADVIDHRLASGARWHNNDLIDILFLCCATAYADAVGAEKAATEYIRRSWPNRIGTPPIFAKLAELQFFVSTQIADAKATPTQDDKAK